MRRPKRRVVAAFLGGLAATRFAVLATGLWIAGGCSEKTAPPVAVPAGTVKDALPPDDSGESHEIKKLRRLGADLPENRTDSSRMTNESITKLYLGSTRFTGDDVELLLKFPNLEVLNVSGKDLNDDFLKTLQELKHLKKLHLNGVPITDAGLAHLAAFSDLDELWLIGTKISDEGLSHLTGCSKLAALSIEATATTDGCIGSLQKLENLTILRVANTKITDAGIQELIAALPNCRVLKN
jgi:hypothetical protein